MTVAELREILADMPDTAAVLVGAPNDGPREYLEVQGVHGRATSDGWLVLEIAPSPSGPEEGD
jgi:hypothetical protein